jgi:hypothetical protein
MRKICVERRIILKQILKDYAMVIRNGFVWLRIGTSGPLL